MNAVCKSASKLRIAEASSLPELDRNELVPQLA